MSVHRWSRIICLAIVLLSLSTLSATCFAIATPTPIPPTVTPAPTATLTNRAASLPTTVASEPQVFVFGQPAGPVKLDPAVTTDAASALVAAQLYDTLVRFVPGTTRIEPALAINWAVSSDGHIWEFRLRDGVKFHDGTPLTAQTVVWNFQRWMDPDHPAHKGDFRYWEGMFGGFEDEQNLEGHPDSLVASVEALDDQTIRLVLNIPFAPLLHNLAMGAFAILNPDAVMSVGAEAYGTPGNPLAVGTGPFRLIEWRDGEIVLRANPEYWDGPPVLSQLIFRTIPDDKARFAALKAGEIDGMTSPAPEDLTEASWDSNVQIVMDPKPTTAFLNFNLDDDYLGQRQVRRAIAQAINKPALVEAAFGPTWQVATQMLPPALWGYNDTIEDYPYDPEGARELLAEVGLPPQFQVDLWYPDRPRPYLPKPRMAAEMIAQDLQAAGMDVRLETEHWSAYLADRNQGAFSMWLLGWTGYNGDPDSFFFYHFGMPTPREGNYVNKELRALLLQGQVITDPETREELYRKAAAIIYADIPRLFLAHPREPILLSSEVVGFTPNPAGSETFLDVTLRPQ